MPLGLKITEESTNTLSQQIPTLEGKDKRTNNFNVLSLYLVLSSVYVLHAARVCRQQQATEQLLGDKQFGLLFFGHVLDGRGEAA